jgi:hypothetical protein
MTIADWTLKTGATLVIAFLLGMPMARADALLDEDRRFHRADLLYRHQGARPSSSGQCATAIQLWRASVSAQVPAVQAPDGDTIMRIGSITKVFTGDVLAHMVAKGTVALTDPLTKWQPDLGPSLNGDLERVTLLNLATHAGGFPREVPHEDGPDTDPLPPSPATLSPPGSRKSRCYSPQARRCSTRISASTC